MTSNLHTLFTSSRGFTVNKKEPSKYRNLEKNRVHTFCLSDPALTPEDVSLRYISIPSHPRSEQ